MFEGRMEYFTYFIKMQFLQHHLAECDTA